MENKIPLPTDSIYKFYALFGLLLFIFSIGSTIYVSRSTNELVFTSAIEFETLKVIEKPTSVEIARYHSWPCHFGNDLRLYQIAS